MYIQCVITSPLNIWNVVIIQEMCYTKWHLPQRCLRLHFQKGVCVFFLFWEQGDVEEN